MPAVTPEDLRKACKKEKDPRVVKRMVAVNMTCNHGQSHQETADMLMQCPNWVSFWVKRFEEGGIDALRDLPRSGRRPMVSTAKIIRIIHRQGGIVTPKKIRNDIHKEFGVRYHITNIRRIMNKIELTPKTVQRVHAGRAGMEKIRKWQRNAKRRISRLQKRGFTVTVFDEAIFVNDPASGAKYWSPKGEPIVTTYNGRHEKMVAYGSMATDGRRFFRTYERFNKETVLQYLGELERHFGKVAIIMDNAPQHKAKIVGEFLDGNANVKAMWLPTATPELSAVEEYWHQSKRDILVSEYYGTVAEMRRTMSEYFRTAQPKLDVMKFICRKSLNRKNF